jgi:hypothetical protein
MLIKLSHPAIWIAGDCWLNTPIEAAGIEAIWGERRPGLFLFNLECAIPAGAVRPGRRALLPLDPRHLAGFGLGDKTVCILANNHVSDWGAEGLMATVNAVRDAGMYTLGAGANLHEARGPLLVDAGGVRIGLLAYADTRPWVGAVAATDRSPGVAPLEPALIDADIAALKDRVEEVWLFVHWGREHLRYPEPEQRRLCAGFAASGATLVVGIHPHVLRGCEHISGAAVYYSIGNFVFPSPRVSDGATLRWHSENRQGMALKGRVDRGGCSWQYIPYTVSCAGLPARPPAREMERLYRKVVRLSSELSDPAYSLRYPRLRRREVICSAIRRFSTMTWRERAGGLTRVFRRVMSPLHLQVEGAKGKTGT